jgi:hypothetical protein
MDEEEGFNETESIISDEEENGEEFKNAEDDDLKELDFES